MNPSISHLSPSHSQVLRTEKPTQFLPPSSSSILQLISPANLSTHTHIEGPSLEEDFWTLNLRPPVGAHPPCAGPWQSPCHTALAHQLTGPLPSPWRPQLLKGGSRVSSHSRTQHKAWLRAGVKQASEQMSE